VVNRTETSVTVEKGMDGETMVMLRPSYERAATIAYGPNHT
jgi:hypothetical protein